MKLKLILVLTLDLQNCVVEKEKSMLLFEGVLCPVFANFEYYCIMKNFMEAASYRILNTFSGYSFNSVLAFKHVL